MKGWRALSAMGLLVIASLTQPAAGVQQAVDLNELARCAAISNSTERLACYDAIAAVSVPGVRIPAAPAPATVAADGERQGSSSASAPTAAGTPVAAATPAPASTGPDEPANFGLSPRQLKSTPKGPESIKAIVSLLTEDRQNHVSLVLDNGQTWSFIEPDPHVRPGDTVTIKKASLGSFLMTTPSRRSYRVERVK